MTDEWFCKCTLLSVMFEVSRQEMAFLFKKKTKKSVYADLGYLSVQSCKNIFWHCDRFWPISSAWAQARSAHRYLLVSEQHCSMRVQQPLKHTLQGLARFLIRAFKANILRAKDYLLVSVCRLKLFISTNYSRVHNIFFVPLCTFLFHHSEHLVWVINRL